MSYAYLACSVDEQNAKEDLNLDTDWGFEKPNAEIDLYMEPYVTKASARFVVLIAERQKEKKQAVVKQFVLETACKVVGFVLFVYFLQKIRGVYAGNVQDMVVSRDASDGPVVYRLQPKDEMALVATAKGLPGIEVSVCAASREPEGETKDFWDEVETLVGGDVVVDLDASACKFPVCIYATECGHGSMFSKEGVKEVLDESEMPSILNNAPNIWMESTLNTSNSADTYACVDENCDEEKLINEFLVACEDDHCIIEDACMQSNALLLQTIDVNHGNKKEACECSINNKYSKHCLDSMSYAYLACSADKQNAEEDLNLDTDWGFEEPNAKIDLCNMQDMVVLQDASDDEVVYRLQPKVEMALVPLVDVVLPAMISSKDLCEWEVMHSSVRGRKLPKNNKVATAKVLPGIEAGVCAASREPKGETKDFWDEVETPVGGDVVVDLDASACNFPVCIYATECGHGSMFSKDGVKEVLDESEMPSVLNNAPNIWMESTLNTSNSEDTYACVDENCDE
ncbi:hypothetical protein L7F22_051451 [Adiantum nelumboides]|nr:hypothetical protein [Adiantum nelumboides]